MTTLTRTFGPTRLTTSAVGLGCMGMSNFYGPRDDAESLATIERALDLGVTLLDTADMYGPWTNEVLVGKAIKGRRDQVVVATKGGQEVDDNGVWTRRMNGRPEYIRKAAEGSLRRLGVECIDLYYTHRVDPEVPVEETFGALGDLVAAGKIRALGMCEASPHTIRRANAVAPLSAVQTEYSLFTRDVEINGVLDTCRELGLAFVAYSPLGRGFLTGTISDVSQLAEDDIRRAAPRFQPGNFERNSELVAELKGVAKALGITLAQLALAWLLGQGDEVIAIPGTRRQKYLEENVASTEVQLSPYDFRMIDELVPPEVVSGPRYAETFLKTTYL